MPLANYTSLNKAPLRYLLQVCVLRFKEDKGTISERADKIMQVF
jgi:hypothetical protein